MSRQRRRLSSRSQAVVSRRIGPAPALYEPAAPSAFVMDSKTTYVVIALLVVSVVTLAVMRTTVPSSPSVGASSKIAAPSIEPKGPVGHQEAPDESKDVGEVTNLPEAEDLFVRASDLLDRSSPEGLPASDANLSGLVEHATGSDMGRSLTAESRSVSLVSSLQGRVSEEEMARAFELLGRMLGLPEVSPEELKEKVEAVGKLQFLRQVPVDFMPREELAEYIKQLFEEEYSVDTAKREERALRALGFLTSGQDLRSIRFRVLNENIAGFYDDRPHVKKLFAISSGHKLNLMNQLVLSHELRHAIQDQHLNLRQVLGARSDYDDRRLAALSLIEGDATLLMERYMSSGGGQESSGLESLLGGLGEEALDGRGLADLFAGPELRNAPPVVREQLIVPYLEGRRLANEIHRRGGFKLINECLERLPRSMEQVLHPEKYLDRVEEPFDVSLSEVAGQELEFEGTVGESFLKVLFESVLSQEEGDRAAAGWGGDRYGLWRGEDGRYHLLWRTVWDTDLDSSEFFEAISRFSSVRFSRGPTPSTDSGRLELEGKDGSRSVVSRAGREVVLERIGFH